MNWNLLLGRFIPFYPLFIYLFNNLFISVWTHRYLFYSLGYNPVLLFILLLKLFHFWALGVFWGWLLCSFSFFPWTFLYFHGSQDATGASCIFPAPVLKSAISLISLVPFIGEYYLETKIWSLGNTHCDLGVTASKPLRGQTRKYL